MYMMKVSKSIESGFIYVLGVSSEMIQKDFLDHLKFSIQTMWLIVLSQMKINWI